MREKVLEGEWNEDDLEVSDEGKGPGPLNKAGDADDAAKGGLLQGREDSFLPATLNILLDRVSFFF